MCVAHSQAQGSATAHRREALDRNRLLGQSPDAAVGLEAPDRREDVRLAFNPRGAWQEWVVGRVAAGMNRLDRAEVVEQKLRAYAAYRAIDFWDEDRALEAEAIAASLARRPGRTVARLRQNPAGCDWLIRAWRDLAAVPAAEWTPDQNELARHLTGDEVGTDPQAPGFAAGRVAELVDRREMVEEADAVRRALVEAGHLDADVPGLAQLRRDARATERHLRWYVDHLATAPAAGPAADPRSTRPDGTNPIAPTPGGPETDGTNPIERVEPPARPLAGRSATDFAPLGRPVEPSRASRRARRAASARERAAAWAGERR